MSTQSDTGQKLTFATVDLDPSGEMAVTWDLSNPLPDTGAALVSLVATSADHKSRSNSATRLSTDRRAHISCSTTTQPFRLSFPVHRTCPILDASKG
jgi:hypothetical protein